MIISFVVIFMTLFTNGKTETREVQKLVNEQKSQNLSLDLLGTNSVHFPVLQNCHFLPIKLSP